MHASAEERWLEMRVLYEQGIPAEPLATIGSLTVKALLQKAAREGWRLPEEGDAARFERIREAQALVIAEVDAAMAEGGEGGLNKARIETAAAALKIVERLLETERATQLARQQAERARQADREEAERARDTLERVERDAESARESQEKRDAEIADVLRSIEEQITVLARDYAKQLVAEQAESRQDRSDRA